MATSTPSIQEFDPCLVPWQRKPILDIRKRFDYSQGVHELLFSGSVGSAKSIEGAHLAVTHCLMYPGARLMLGRRSLKDIKDTIFQKIIEHIQDDLVEGRDFHPNWTLGSIEFSNGSEIISRSWADKKFKKFRSLELSTALIEEATENNEDDKEAIDEIRMRVGRLPHIPESWIIYMTNPDGPDHWLYKDMIIGSEEDHLKHVYYSLTRDNPFLPPSYEEKGRKNLDPKMAMRMFEGKWVEIAKEVIYYQYDRAKHFKKEQYKIDPRFPIRISFDFNIAIGKPMSCVLFQYDTEADHFHFFTEAVVQGARTEDILDELQGRGLLDFRVKYIVHGDATGANNNTRSKKSDYDIIDKYLANYKGPHGYIKYKLKVPKQNPPVRKRHNLVNGYLENSSGQIRVSLYPECKTLDEGFRLTKLKDGGQYIEDDSKHFQHITTAAGYGICSSATDNDGPTMGVLPR